MMNFLVLLLFILFSFPKSFAGNLANCYEATDAKEESNVKECKVEGGGTQKLVYPQKDKSGVPIAGCYSLTFQRVSDIPGDPVTGKCESSNAPIRYYLKYRTVCSNGKASCRYGSQIIISPEVTLDTQSILGEGFNPGLNLGLPIKLTKGAKAYTALESCEVLAKKNPSYIWDPVAQTCSKLPSALCKEVGFYWSEADSKCISHDSRTVAAEPDLCPKEVCQDDPKFCSGGTFFPAGKNCYCEGASTSLLDRDTASPDYKAKAACQWLHYDVQMNPVCEKWNESVEYVADPTKPNLDRCCKNGNCKGFKADPSASSPSDTTPKKKENNPNIYRNFLIVGPSDKFPDQSPGKNLSPDNVRP